MRFAFVFCSLLASVFYNGADGYQRKTTRGRFRDYYEKRLSAVPTVPPIPGVPLKKQPFELIPAVGDPCTSNRANFQLCKNGGRCVRTEDNSYYCKCKEGFFHSRCEYLANPRNCEGNKCRNGATCYSVDETHAVFDVEFIVETKYLPDGTEETERKPRKIKRLYHCWCPPGFQGDFCEYGPEEVYCAEVWCHHRGISTVVMRKNTTTDGKTKCKCECGDDYLGDRCNITSPCLNFGCKNAGSCVVKRKVKRRKRLYYHYAKCNCVSVGVDPTKIGKFKGKHCETFVGELCADPCADNWECYKSLKDIAGHDFEKLKEIWPIHFLDSEKAVCGPGRCSNDVRWLYNKADPFNAEKSSPIFYNVPVCHCEPPGYGSACQYENENKCQLTPEEKKILNRQERCLNGTCRPLRDTEHGYFCECFAGWQGDVCEETDPCSLRMNQPCGSGKCVKLPEHLGTYFDVTYACVCLPGQLLFDQGTDYGSSGIRCLSDEYGICNRTKNTAGMCRNGTCFPCDFYGDAALGCPTYADRKRGYFCLCNPGVDGTFCNSEYHPCDDGPCLNYGTCHHVTDGSRLEQKFDYWCGCERGFGGRDCEIRTSSCVAWGDEVCMNGVCVDVDDNLDNSTGFRGFRCECEDNFAGIDCEYDERISTFGAYMQANSFWLYPLLTGIFMLIVFCLFVISEESSRRKEERIFGGQSTLKTDKTDQKDAEKGYGYLEETGLENEQSSFFAEEQGTVEENSEPGPKQFLPQGKYVEMSLFPADSAE